MIRFMLIPVLVTICLSAPGFAQTPPAPPKKSPVPAPPVSAPKTSPARPAPQVVTVLHRLNGLKMFRMLLRSEQDVQAIAHVDEAFRLMEDVHTNVIAGLALEDGQTIVAWLPDAELEFGPMAIAFGEARRAKTKTSPKASTPKVVAGNQNWKKFFVAQPELSVIGPDGRELEVHFVGLDGQTGLSILKLAEKTPAAPKLAEVRAIPVGSNLRVLGPELAMQTKLISQNSLFVRMGETSGTVQAVALTPSGDVARMKLHSPHLNLSSVGSVAINASGEAVGIVSGIEGFDATLLPATVIQGAANRVLAQQTSVPRPFLGVRGEPLATTGLTQVEGFGWDRDRAANLLEERHGILLTSIVPDSPASDAQLQAGDVILKVNGEQIQNGEDFSWFLDQAGTSNSVSFTVVRPKSTEVRAVDVKLSGALDRFSFRLTQSPVFSTRQSALLSRGIETVVLRPAVAARLGASAGLLVVYVEPATVAADSGLQAGDVIESIDGASVANPTMFRQLSKDPSKPHELKIVRKKQKMVVTLQNDGN